MTRTVFRLAAALALLSTSQLQAAASAPARPCLTPAELRAMIAYMMPSATTLLIERCKSALPAGASLLSHGVELSRTLETARAASFPLARQAFTKFSDTGDKFTAGLILTLPEAALRPIVEATISKDLIGTIKVTDCPNIDRVFATLEPLPASNFVDLVTQVMTITARDNKQMSVCGS